MSLTNSYKWDGCLLVDPTDTYSFSYRNLCKSVLSPGGSHGILDEPIFFSIVCCIVAYNRHSIVEEVGASSLVDDATTVEQEWQVRGVDSSCDWSLRHSNLELLDIVWNNIYVRNKSDSCILVIPMACSL